MAQIVAITDEQNGNGTGPAATATSIDATFWPTLVFTIISPLLVLGMAAICRQEFLQNFHFTKRQRHYDIRSLRRSEVRTPTRRLNNILCFRPRPLPFEILKVALELVILLYLVGFVALQALVILWCIFDVGVGFQVLNYVYLKHTHAARGATRLAAYIYGGYSLLYGFPLGFVAKLIWIVWLKEETTFSVLFIPFYIEAVAAVIFVVLFMCPNICWRVRLEGLRSASHKLKLVGLFIGFFVLWFVAYYSISVCHGPPVVKEGKTFDFNVFSGKCSSYFNSWTTSLIPLFVLVVLSLYVLLWTILSEGMFYRFLPEALLLWSEAVVLLTSFHSLDTGDERILLGAGALIGASIIGSIFTNIILLFDILRALAAPAQPPGDDGADPDDPETKKRGEMRRDALRDFNDGGRRASLKGTLLANIKQRDRMRQCVICFDDFRRGHTRKSLTTTVTEESLDQGTAPDDVLGIIKTCGHYFHFNCVWDWIQRQTTCPLCRIDIELTKDAIKTVNYDDVRYAFAQARPGRTSVFGTVSELIHSRTNLLRDRESIGSSMSFFSRRSALSSSREAGVDSDQVGRNSSREFPTSNKFCSICKESFPTTRQSKDIVVGYLRGCGHYFHCICIDKFVRKYERCPKCSEPSSTAQSLVEQGPSTNYQQFNTTRSHGNMLGSSLGERVTNTDVLFAFLSDVHTESKRGQKKPIPFFGESSAVQQ